MKNKITGILIALCIALSIVFSGCSDCSGCDKKEEVAVVSGVEYKGVHELNATETNEWLVKDGKTDYVVVVPSETSATINVAKDEFIDLFRMATGITLSIVKDAGLTHTENGKYISLGETKLFESSGLSVDKKELTKDGIRIITKDKTVYLVGGSDYGTVYSVYDFMKLTFDYEYFYNDCIQIEKNVRNKKLSDFNVKDIPDMKDRKGGWFPQLWKNTNNIAYRVKLASSGGIGLPVYTDYDETKLGGSGVHTTDKLLPKATYQQEHPKWYTTVNAEGGKQLCYTARGDSEEFEAMAQECAKKIEFALTVNKPADKPFINNCYIGMEDTYDACACEECTRLKEYYGAESGAVCIFVNRVAELVDEWMNDPKNAEFYREEFYIMLLAYNNFIDAPVKYDEAAKKYVAVDDKVKLRDNVGVYYADIKQDWQSSLFSEANKKTLVNLQGWSELAKRIDHYVYAINYNTNSTNLAPYDTFNYFTDEMFRYYMSIGSRGYYVCNIAGYSNDGDYEVNWGKLKLYLQTNLLWDCNQSEAELMDKWFNAMFADAAPVMRSFFDLQRVYMSELSNKNGFYVQDSIYINLKQKSLFPQNVLLQWMGMCDTAANAIAKYKEADAEYYKTLLTHIEAEYLAPAHIYLSLYKEDLLDGVKYEVRDRIYNALSLMDIEDIRLEGFSNSSLVKSLKSI